MWALWRRYRLGMARCGRRINWWWVWMKLRSFCDFLYSFTAVMMIYPPGNNCEGFWRFDIYIFLPNLKMGIYSIELINFYKLNTKVMYKLAILSTLAFSTLSYKPHKCPQDYLWTIEGCIKDCKSSLFINCPDFYTLQFEPNFCGLNEDGYWSEYTYECQACSTPGVVGVIEGACKEYQK